MKKMLAYLVVLTMLVGMVNVTAFADSEFGDTIDWNETYFDIIDDFLDAHGRQVSRQDIADAQAAEWAKDDVSPLEAIFGGSHETTDREFIAALDFLDRLVHEVNNANNVFDGKNNPGYEAKVELPKNTAITCKDGLGTDYVYIRSDGTIREYHGPDGRAIAREAGDDYDTTAKKLVNNYESMLDPNYVPTGTITDVEYYNLLYYGLDNSNFTGSTVNKNLGKAASVMQTTGALTSEQLSTIGRDLNDMVKFNIIQGDSTSGYTSEFLRTYYEDESGFHNTYVPSSDPVLDPATGMVTFWFISTEDGSKCKETVSIDKMEGVTSSNFLSGSSLAVLAGYARRFAAYHNTTDYMSGKTAASTIISDYKDGIIPEDVLHNDTFGDYVKKLLVEDTTLNDKARSTLGQILCDSAQTSIVSVDGEYYAVRGQKQLVKIDNLGSVVKDMLDADTIKNADSVLLDIIWTSGLFETLDEEKKQAFKDTVFAQNKNLTKVVFSDGTSLTRNASVYNNMSQGDFYSMINSMSLTTLENMKNDGTYDQLNNVFKTMLDSQIAQIKARTATAAQSNLIAGITSAVSAVATKGANIVVNLFQDVVGTISSVMKSAASFLKQAAETAIANKKATQANTSTKEKSYSISLGGSKYSVTGANLGEAVAKAQAQAQVVLNRRASIEEEDFKSQSRAYSKALDDEKAKAEAKIAAASSTSGKSSSGSSSAGAVAGVVAGIVSTVNVITTAVKTLAAVVTAVTTVASALRSFGGLGSQTLTTK